MRRRPPRSLYAPRRRQKNLAPGLLRHGGSPAQRLRRTCSPPERYARPIGAGSPIGRREDFEPLSQTWRRGGSPGFISRSNIALDSRYASRRLIPPFFRLTAFRFLSLHAADISLRFRRSLISASAARRRLLKNINLEAPERKANEIGGNNGFIEQERFSHATYGARGTECSRPGQQFSRPRPALA